MNNDPVITDSPPGQPSNADAGGGYSPGQRAAAVIGTLVAPFLSLIAALVMLSSERSEERRKTLRSWAIFSGAWLATGFILVIFVASAILGSMSPPHDRSGPCVGGPILGAPGRDLGGDRFEFDCAISGTTRMYFGDGSPSPTDSG